MTLGELHTTPKIARETEDAGAPTGRRQVLRWLGGGGLVLLGGGAALLGGRKEHLLRASTRVMGTRATILLGAHSPEWGREAVASAFAEVRWVDQLMSRFRPESDIGWLNAHPGEWRRVHSQTAAVLDAALKMARASDGRFDPCLDGVISRWGFHDRHYPERLPSTLPNRGAADPPYRSLQGAEISSGGPASERSFRLRPGGYGLDLGGIAKGYAIDRAVLALRRAGAENALVNVGDDLFALGRHPDGASWRIGVRHPRRQGGLLQVMTLKNRAVATSGDYENFFLKDGLRYAHLIDPRSGQPAGHHQSLTVTATTAMTADALASAAFVTPAHQTRELLTRLGDSPWLAVGRDGEQSAG